MNFTLVEFLIIAIMVALLGLLFVGLYNDATSEKIALNKSEWVCASEETKLMLINGKALPHKECNTYIKR